MKHIIRISGETEPEVGMKLAAEKIAADVTEESARALVSRMAQLIFMLEYIEHTGYANEQDVRNLAIFKECFSAAQLPTPTLAFSTPRN